MSLCSYTCPYWKGQTFGPKICVPFGGARIQSGEVCCTSRQVLGAHVALVLDAVHAAAAVTLVLPVVTAAHARTAPCARALLPLAPAPAVFARVLHGCERAQVSSGEEGSAS